MGQCPSLSIGSAEERRWVVVQGATTAGSDGHQGNSKGEVRSLCFQPYRQQGRRGRQQGWAALSAPTAGNGGYRSEGGVPTLSCHSGSPTSTVLC